MCRNSNHWPGLILHRHICIPEGVAVSYKKALFALCHLTRQICAAQMWDMRICWHHQLHAHWHIMRDKTSLLLKRIPGKWQHGLSAVNRNVSFRDWYRFVLHVHFYIRNSFVESHEHPTHSHLEGHGICKRKDQIQGFAETVNKGHVAHACGMLHKNCTQLLRNALCISKGGRLQV